MLLTVLAVLTAGTALVSLVATGTLAEARGEFQGRLREIALRRTQRALLIAIGLGVSAATIAGFHAAGGDIDDLPSPVPAAHAAEQPALQLKLSTSLSVPS